ncbi:MULTISPECIES: hypothetical protein [Streptomyces]|uniref:hypothetical protein n=1 Tax=Streptomyces TaxID=1883 RepID=UPI00140AF235|nr:MULTISPECIES: hypothetical protein [Streptomyces]MDH6226039.1 hypothetical protein [Streptomyces sp. MJP52]
MRNHPLAAAAALIALGLLPVLCGCSSSGGPDPSAAAAREPDDRAAGRPSSGVRTPGQGTPGSPAPVLPDAEIKAPKGSGEFSGKEKEYLSGRVPEQMEPAAVLDLGKEACQRIGRTAKHDRDAAVAALVTGEVPNAEPAVTHLCPEHGPLLEAAGEGYPDGTHGKPAAGGYRTASAAPSCTWSVTGAGGEELAAGPGTGGRKDGTYTMTVPSGAARLVSSGCYAWLRD